METCNDCNGWGCLFLDEENEFGDFVTKTVECKCCDGLGLVQLVEEE